jgi:hypothetical protein
MPIPTGNEPCRQLLSAFHCRQAVFHNGGRAAAGEYVYSSPYDRIGQKQRYQEIIRFIRYYFSILPKLHDSRVGGVGRGV